MVDCERGLALQKEWVDGNTILFSIIYCFPNAGTHVPFLAMEACLCSRQTWKCR